VLAVVSDKKLRVDSDSDGDNDYYLADVRGGRDYYAFGMQIPSKAFSESSLKYRYGFNGKENDDEVKGAGNQQDYGMRIYDPRLGRFLSVDPYYRKYSMLTPYQFASNRPIEGIDLDGLEFFRFNNSYIRMSVEYNNKIGRITNSQTYYRANEKRVGTFLSEYVLPNILNDQIINQRTSIVSNVTYNPKPVNTTEDASMNDTDDALPPTILTPIIPQNNEQRRKQIKTKQFYAKNSGSTIKMNGALAIIEITGNVLEKIGETRVNNIINNAEGYQTLKSLAVVGILQEAINNKKIDTKFLNNTSLSKLANYLLFGENIVEGKFVNGTYQFIENKELTSLGKSLWDSFIQRKNEKEFNEKMRTDTRQKIDNTGVNNGGGYNP
jgi:RHS repeat-associated protein